MVGRRGVQLNAPTLAALPCPPPIRRATMTRVSQTIVSLNGQLLPRDEARVSVFDHGLLYGHALFETMRSYQGKVFRLQEHLARLQRGTQELGIPLSDEESALEHAIDATIRANDLSDARVRITVTAGEGEAGPASPPESGPTIFVTASALPPEPQEAYEKGHRAIISSVRRSSLSAVPRLKSTNLLENILARREAQEKGADQAILVNEKRCITECASANIFFIAYGGLVTPSLDCGLLPGITRDAMIELALRMNIPIEERWVTAEEVWDTEELFVTSSVIGVYPVTSVNDRPIRGGSPGKITRALTMAYHDLVRGELSLTASQG